MNRILAALLCLPLLVSIADAAAQSKRVLRIIAFGAHPDDAEIQLGGCAIKWAQLGHKVKLVSVTNGDIGHWKMAGGPLAKRRTAESKEAAKRMGVESLVLDIHDGEIMPTLANRKTIARLIREWQADLVFTHRPHDYHPDHRNAGLLIRDAAFMVGVPFYVPDTPPVKRNPVFMYFPDRSTRPYPSQADIAISIDDVFGKKCLHLTHWNHRFTRVARKEILKASWTGRNGRIADLFRESLVKWYGPEKGKDVKTAEAFEVC